METPPTYKELADALDRLHIACETSRPDIFDWYQCDVFASAARMGAIEALNAITADKQARTTRQPIVLSDKQKADFKSGVILSAQTPRTKEDKDESRCTRLCEFAVDFTKRQRIIWGRHYREMGGQSRHASWKQSPVDPRMWDAIRYNAACLAVWIPAEMDKTPAPAN